MKIQKVSITQNGYNYTLYADGLEVCNLDSQGSEAAVITMFNNILWKRFKAKNTNQLMRSVTITRNNVPLQQYQKFLATGLV